MKESKEAFIARQKQLGRQTGFFYHYYFNSANGTVQVKREPYAVCLMSDGREYLYYKGELDYHKLMRDKMSSVISCGGSFMSIFLYKRNDERAKDIMNLFYENKIDDLEDKLDALKVQKDKLKSIKY